MSRNTKENTESSLTLQVGVQDHAANAQLPASGPGRGNWKHGGRSRVVAAALMPEQAAGLALLPATIAAIESDLGGSESLSVIKRGLVTEMARLQLIVGYLGDNVGRLGPLTGKGRTRAALTAYLQAFDRLQRLAATLGLERVTKPLGTLEDVQRAVERVNA